VEQIVESDFAAAKVRLRAARRCLHGSDKISGEAIEALDLLIVAVTTAEFVRNRRNVVPFRAKDENDFHVMIAHE
jgi:hypothetical protein